MRGNILNAKVTLSVGAQALVSGFHFVLNLVLLTVLSQYDYGLFAYAFVLAMFAQAVNNALISTPLTVYTPVIKDPKERLEQERMLSGANFLFSLILMLAGVIYLFLGDQRWDTALGVTAFVTVYAARHFSRSFGYARLKPLVTASGDICYVVSGTIIVAVLLLFIEELTVGEILIALTLANLLAMMIEKMRLHGPAIFAFNYSSLKNYHVIWEQSRWALVGAVTTLLMGHAHSLIITNTHGPSAYAPLAAGFVLFGPVRVALATWQNMVKPEIAVSLSEHRFSEVRTQILRTATMMGFGVLIMGGILYLLWPSVHSLLYAKKYGDEPMGFIVCMWAVVTLFAAVYNAPCAGLQALKNFQVLAYASIYGAIISIVGVSIALLKYEPETTLYAILLAEFIMAVFVLRALHRKLQERL